jgi:hypothetical protein
MANEFRIKNGLLVDQGTSQITGSLIVSGSQIITGSLNVSQGITGSLFGTASYATQALTASFALNANSASFTTSSSFASQALTASTIDVSLFGNPVESYLLMSNAAGTTGVAVGADADLRYNANTNALTLSTGTITALSFTGSLLGTASFAVSSSRAVSASFATTASFLTSTTNAFLQNGNSFGTTALLGTNDNQPLALETNGTTRMFISSSGDVGIGTTIPDTKLQIEDVTKVLTNNVAGVAQGTLSLVATDAQAANVGASLVFGGNYINSSQTRIAYAAITGRKSNSSSVNADGYLSFLTWRSTGLTEAMRVTANGDVGIGTTSPNARLDVSGSAIISGSLTVTPGTVREFQVRSTGVDIGNIITDTHTVTGSLNVSGSITGSLFGTASFATSASQATTATSVSSIAGNITNNVDNYVLTATGGGTINGESSLTFNGSVLVVDAQMIQGTVGNTVTGGGAHAEGNLTIADGGFSHAEGFTTNVYGDYSHAEGYQSKTGNLNTFLTLVVSGGEFKIDSGYGDVTGIFVAGNPMVFSDIDYNNNYGIVTFIISTVTWDGTNTIIQLTDTSVATTTAVVGDLTTIGSWSAYGGDQPIGPIAAHAEGYYITALGANSHAEGNNAITSGEGSHAEGAATIAGGVYSHAEGESTQAIGNVSHAEGNGTKAIGDSSHAEGRTTIASGPFSHAEGRETIAEGEGSHAEGYLTSVLANFAHAEGYLTTASADYSHAEGNGTWAKGSYSHAEGHITVASANYSHAEGYNTSADVYAHAEGYQTAASAQGSHAEGFGTIALGPYSHAEGVTNNSTGNSSHAEGGETTSTGERSHAEGSGSVSFGTGSHAEGRLTRSSGSFSHAEGSGSISRGDYSHAEGSNTIASGTFSHAEGLSNTSFGSYSHVEGVFTNAFGNGSHAEGFMATARGEGSHAEGGSTLASGSYSHAEGNSTTTIGQYSHAEGWNTVTSGTYQHVQGQYNISSSFQSAFIIGNGTSNTSRSNLIYASGSEVQITGSLNVTGNFNLLGTASIQFISESTLNIGTNLITVNTINPGARFGGLAVIDSGSSPLVSASFLYDSIQDEFIFVHKGTAAAAITSSVFLLGPETYNNLGNETYLTANRIPKGTGIEHLNDSNISDNGSVVTINSNTQVTGSLIATGSTIITGSLRGNVSALFVSSNTASLDLTTNNFFTINLSNSTNIHISASNIRPGQTVNLRVSQSSAGTGTVSFNSGIEQASGSLYTGSMIANAEDIVTFISFDSSRLYMSALRNLI